MLTSGTANGKAPLSLGESVTAKNRDGLTETCADDKSAVLAVLKETNVGLKEKFGRTN